MKQPYSGANPRFIGLRMSDEEYAHLQALTRERGLEISAVVRALIAQATPTDTLLAPRESGKGSARRVRRELVSVEG